MDARVAALEASNSKNQVILETIQRLLEDKFTSIDKRLDSIDSHREGSNSPLTSDVNDVVTDFGGVERRKMGF